MALRAGRHQDQNRLGLEAVTALLKVDKALVSVVIPSYNCAQFLTEAISSVFRQSYRPLELIIVDDGSTDASRKVIRHACRQPPVDNFILIEQPNQGAHAAIMTGLRAASGEYLSILNCDDFYHPDRFSRLIPRLDDGSALVFSGVRFVDAHGRDLPPDNAWPSWHAKALAETDHCPTIGFALLTHNFSVSSGNFVFRRDLYDKLGGFSDHRFIHDWDFLLRSVHYSEPLFFREPLLFYRIHDNNTTETVRDRLRDEWIDALQRYVHLVTSESSPNPLAPCPTNWPRYFARFAQSSPISFSPDEHLADFWERSTPR